MTSPRPFIRKTLKRIDNAFRHLTSSLRVLPDFLIIGAQRSGTTSLYNYLIRHPKIIPSSKKEVHYFDLNYRKGTRWYRAQFPVKFVKGDSLTGEASPAYLFHPHVPRRVHSLLPHVKLIVMLRNPIDRAYSHYWREFKKGRETLSFEEAIAAEKKRLEKEIEKILDDEDHISLSFFYYSYLTRGIYIEQLKRWFNYFPREQFLIICSEDFYSNPSKIYKEVLRFLNLPPWELEEYPIYLKGDYPPMNPETRRKLTEFFKPYNEELFQLLGRRFNWNE